MDIAFFLKTVPGFTFKTLPADIRIFKGDLEKDRDLETAILLSLFTNRRAETSDKVIGDNRGGFWGSKYINEFASNQTITPQLGSRLWLLKGGKVTRDTLNFARIYANEALKWLIDDGAVKSIIVNPSALKTGGILLDIKVYKPDESSLTYSYGYIWSQIIEQSGE